MAVHAHVSPQGAAPIEREAAHAALADAVAQAEKEGAAAAMAIVDVDWCGRINRDRGRAAGDALLKALAKQLKTAAGSGGTAFRYGGDAFCVVWRGVEKEQAFLRVEQVRAALESDQVTVSAGVAGYPDDGAAATDLVNKAFEALYRAKVSGRNKVCLAREEKMVTKTSHYTQGQVLGLRRLAEREGIKDAELLREALNDLLRKYNA
ncbi:MAG: diguanylate cyclase [Candidatus Hydrogenedentes bacterium]|nr:diguanylate cyclase [Candidatus Hydrogenedentota bacterium]